MEPFGGVPQPVIVQFLVSAFEFLECRGSVILSEGARPLIDVVMEVLSMAQPPDEGPSLIRGRDRAALVIGILRLCDDGASHAEIFQRVNDSVELVEDSFSLLPKGDDRRIAGPDERFRAKSNDPSCTRVTLYRHRFHATLIGENGALEIRERVKGLWVPVISRPGTDGKSVGDLCREEGCTDE